MARSHKATVFVAYLAGSVTGPLVATLIKPHLRTIAKASILLGLRVRKMVAEAAEDLEDLAAEAVADTTPGAT